MDQGCWDMSERLDLEVKRMDKTRAYGDATGIEVKSRGD